MKKREREREMKGSFIIRAYGVGYTMYTGEGGITLLEKIFHEKKNEMVCLPCGNCYVEKDGHTLNVVATKCYEAINGASSSQPVYGTAIFTKACGRDIKHLNNNDTATILKIISGK